MGEEIDNPLQPGGSSTASEAGAGTVQPTPSSPSPARGGGPGGLEGTGGSPPATSPAASTRAATERQPASAGPVGSGNYEVQQGDCIESIAMDHGFFWKTIWNHPDNLDLKKTRNNPNVLREGDEVFVPGLRPKQEAGATDLRHTFKRKGVPSKISIVLKDVKGQPRPDLDYVLEIDGELSQGKSDAAGRLQHPIPPNAQRGKVIIGSGPGTEEYALQLGHLDPVTEISGVQARLKNLGFDCGQTDGTLNEETRRSLRSFQERFKLTESGEPDPPTRDALLQEHGS